MKNMKIKKSRVNEAGNYTKPTMRKNLFNKIKAGSKGGNSGQWSARKAQSRSGVLSLVSHLVKQVSVIYQRPLLSLCRLLSMLLLLKLNVKVVVRVSSLYVNL
jgi:hypothetical protein